MSRRSSGSKTSQTFTSKIALAMGSILFLFTLVLGYCLYLILTLSTGAGTGTTTESGLIVRQLQGQLQQAAAIQQKVSGQPNDEVAAGFTAAIDNLRAGLTRARQSYQNTGNQAGVRSTEELASLSHQYHTAFLNGAAEAATGSENSSLRGMLDRAAQEFAVLTADEAGPAEAALQKLQSSQQDYLQAPGPETGSRLTDSLAKFAELDLQESFGQAHQLPDIITAYHTAFDRHQALSLATDDPALSTIFAAERKRQQEVLEQQALELKNLVGQSKAAAPLPHVADIVININKYLASADQKFAVLADKAFEDHAAFLADSSLAAERKIQIGLSAQNYRELFNTYVSQHHPNVNVSARLDQLYAGLKSGIDSLPAGNSPVDPEFSAMAGLRAITIPAAAGLAVLLLGCISIFLLGRSIAAPIRRMTEQVRQIKNGRENVISMSGSKDKEISVLAAELNGMLLQRETDTTLAVEKRELEEAAAIEAVAAAQKQLSATLRHIDLFRNDQKTAVAAFEASFNRMRNSIDAAARTTASLGEQHHAQAAAIDRCTESVDSGIKWMRDIARAAADIAHTVEANTELAEQTSVAALNAAIKAARNPGARGELTGVVEKLDTLARSSKETARKLNDFAAHTAKLAGEGAAAAASSDQALLGITETTGSSLKSMEEIGSFLQDLAGQASESENLLSGLQGLDEQLENILHEPGSSADARSLSDPDDTVNQDEAWDEVKNNEEKED
jgi:methyl-accepting chemotaxis protein